MIENKNKFYSNMAQMLQEVSFPWTPFAGNIFGTRMASLQQLCLKNQDAKFIGTHTHIHSGCMGN